MKYKGLWLYMSVVALAYVVAARVGFWLAIPPGNVTAVWPPSGIALAAVLLFGPRMWPGIWAGSFLVNVWFLSMHSGFGVTVIWVTILIATGSTLQALAAGFLIRRFCATRELFNRLTDVFRFLAIEVPCCWIAATFGVTGLCLGGYTDWNAFFYTWKTWWLGDLTGVILFTPFILIWRSWPAWDVRRWTEFVLFLAALTFLSYAVFGQGVAYAYLIIPLIAMTAFRFEQAGIAAAVVVLCIVAFQGLVQANGRLVADSFQYAPLFVQTLLGAAATTGFLIAAVLTERKFVDEELKMVNLQLESKLAELERLNGMLERRETALEQANNRLESLSKTKDEFVATASHELRTPLTAIREGISLIKDRVLGPVNTEQHEFLTAVDANIDRLTALINNILDLAKIESGRLSVARRRVALGDLIRSMVENYRTLGASRNVRFEFSPAPDVFADPDRVTQVLWNLFSNASKFTSENGTIVFSLRPEGRFVAVSVEDNGTGIAKEDFQKLFKKFSQVGATRSRGTGLGLALCKQIVSVHHGEIRVESERGAGSKFTFTLPAYERGAETAEELAGDRLGVSFR